MGLEAFKLACEVMKKNNQVEYIEATKHNLERTGDAERIKVFNEVFAPEKKQKK